MVLTIFIPVLFICMNDRCQFMQGIHYTNESECRAVVEAQKDNLRRMALKGGGMVTQLEGTCVTAKNGML
jgi:hypothetical protein